MPKGHEALAKMVTTEDRTGQNYVASLHLQPRDRGNCGAAKGREYLAVIDIVPGQQGKSHSIYLIGRYDDEYAKTPQGWRFKTRVFTAAARRQGPPASGLQG